MNFLWSDLILTKTRKRKLRLSRERLWLLVKRMFCFKLEIFKSKDFSPKILSQTFHFRFLDFSKKPFCQTHNVLLKFTQSMSESDMKEKQKSIKKIQNVFPTSNIATTLAHPRRPPNIWTFVVGIETSARETEKCFVEILLFNWGYFYGFSLFLSC